MHHFVRLSGMTLFIDGGPNGLQHYNRVNIQITLMNQHNHTKLNY